MIQSNIRSTTQRNNLHKDKFLSCISQVWPTIKFRETDWILDLHKQEKITQWDYSIQSILPAMQITYGFNLQLNWSHWFDLPNISKIIYPESFADTIVKLESLTLNLYNSFCQCACNLLQFYNKLILIISEDTTTISMYSYMF